MKISKILKRLLALLHSSIKLSHCDKKKNFQGYPPSIPIRYNACAYIHTYLHTYHIPSSLNMKNHKQVLLMLSIVIGGVLSRGLSLMSSVDRGDNDGHSGMIRSQPVPSTRNPSIVKRKRVRKRFHRLRNHAEKVSGVDIQYMYMYMYMYTYTHLI